MLNIIRNNYFICKSVEYFTYLTMFTFPNYKCNRAEDATYLEGSMVAKREGPGFNLWIDHEKIFVLACVSSR